MTDSKADPPPWTVFGPNPDQPDAWYLTPATALVTHRALELIADEVWANVDQFGDAPVDGTSASILVEFPAITWKMGGSWRRKLSRAADDLADDLWNGNIPFPRCVAEEVVLRLALHVATTLSLEPSFDARLPKHPGDYDFEAAANELIEVGMVDFLSSQVINDAPDPEAILLEAWPSLDPRPTNWFASYTNYPLRDPRRGFRV